MDYVVNIVISLRIEFLGGINHINNQIKYNPESKK